ncbi:MAG: glycine--tRNA ligase subunit beta, partial [bacterium]
MKKDLLLEIGCENIPSGYLDGALGQIRELFEKGLDSERVPFENVRVMGTPNRLVVLGSGLAVKQDSREEHIVGPPVKVALTKEGKYTKMAAGFAKAQGVPVGSLSKVETEKGEYLAVVRRIRGRSTSSILKERIPAWVQEVRFPKLMRWDGSGLRFARPVRWILCLFGDAVLKFRLGALTAGRSTRLSCYYDISVPVRSIDMYLSLMKRNRIILDQAQRREAVRRLARGAAEKLGGTL